MSALPPKADIAERDGNVRFVPQADILRCGKERRYSITSSARASSVGGIVNPSVLAVLSCIVECDRHVRFVPQADISPIWTP